MKKNHNRFLIILSASLCLHLTSTISAMQMGGFDINVGNGENSSWQWQEEQQWNQSSWENTWENSWQTGDNISEIPDQNNQVQDNGYQYNTDPGNGMQNNTQNNIQQWNGTQQDNTDWNNNDYRNSSSQWYNNNQNNAQNNNANQNNSNQSSNDSTWNNQYQLDNNTQTTARRDNESAVKMPEETSTTLTQIPTSEPTKSPKPTKTPKPLQTLTPKPAKKKNKKKQNKVDKTKKENKRTDNSKELQNKDGQLDSAEYICVKDEPVEFQCIQNSGGSHAPEVRIISKGSVQILSYRLNGIESPWHWNGEGIVPDITADYNTNNNTNNNTNKIELLIISQGGRLIKMTPWIFSS